MLIVKQDDSRKEEDGQIFVELTKNRGLDIVNCDRLGYWCDKAHLSHFIIECASCFTENELKDILKMNKETIEIKKDSVIEVYNTARNTNDYGTLHALETLFGIDFFKPKDVRERIKTFDDACNELGNEHPYVRAYTSWIEHEEYDDQSDILTYLKLRIIAAALNEGWEPTFGKDEWRYFPWFCIYSKEELEEMDEEERSRVVGRAYNNANAYGGLAFAYAFNASSYSVTSSGSRLAFKSEELAVYCGQQFIDIWVDFIC